MRHSSWVTPPGDINSVFCLRRVIGLPGRAWATARERWDLPMILRTRSARGCGRQRSVGIASRSNRQRVLVDLRVGAPADRWCSGGLHLGRCKHASGRTDRPWERQHYQSTQQPDCLFGPLVPRGRCDSAASEFPHEYGGRLVSSGALPISGCPAKLGTNLQT
jgi:hypothetical protein